MEVVVVGEGSSTSSPPNKYSRLNEDEDEYCFFGQEDEDKYVSRMYDYLSTEDEYTMRPVIKDEDKDEDDEDVLRLLSSTDGPMKDADVPRLLPSVDPLPDGAWELWGSRAIYFAAKDVGACRYTYPGNIIYTGLSIYAINPNDQRLPVYHVFDFSFPFPGPCPVWDLRFAIVGSVAYVAGNERLWMRQIGDNDQGYWEDGPRYDMYNCTPLLFSLGGRLYALCYFGVPDPCKDPTSKGYTDAFQVLVDGSWRSLKAPPPCFGCSGLMIGWSCVGDHTIIVHVEHWKPVQRRFYCFRHTDGFSGRWTELDVTPSPSSSPSLCDFVVYCAHLGSNDPLFLFLPVLSRTTMCPVVFGLSGDRLHLGVGREVELPWEEPYHMKHLLYWNLISMGGNRYCAFAFPTEGKLDINIFTFDLHLMMGQPPPLRLCTPNAMDLVDKNFVNSCAGKRTSVLTNPY